MTLECSPQEHELLVELVKARVSELHPTIRRSRNYQVHDELKHDLEVLEQLLERLQATNAGSAV